MKHMQSVNVIPKEKCMQNTRASRQKTVPRGEPPSKENIFSIFNSFILACSTLGTLLGGIVTFNYFKNINQLGVFTSILTQPQTLLVISITFIIIILTCIAIPVLAPYIILQLSNYRTLWLCYKAEGASHPPILSSAIFLTYICTVLLFFVVLFCNANSEQHTMTIPLMLVCPLVIAYLAYRNFSNNIKKISAKRFHIKVSRCLLVKFTFISFIYFALALFSLVLAFETPRLLLSENGDETILAFFIIYLVFLGLNIYLAVKSAYQNRTNWINFYAPSIPVSACITLLFFILSSPVINIKTQFAFLALRIPHFIEIPNDSKWYVINPESNLAKALILHYGNIFNSRFTCSTTDNKHCSSSKQPLALYGYMACNLGDKKVLCPKTVNVTDKQQSIECITIHAEEILSTSDTSYLQ